MSLRIVATGARRIDNAQASHCVGPWKTSFQPRRWRGRRDDQRTVTHAGLDLGEVRPGFQYHLNSWVASIQRVPTVTNANFGCPTASSERVLTEAAIADAYWSGDSTAVREMDARHEGLAMERLELCAAGQR